MGCSSCGLPHSGAHGRRFLHPLLLHRCLVRWHCDVLGLSLYWQIGAFALFTLISLYFVRPVALRYLHRNDEQRLSNADALIGRRGRVVEKIEAGGYGRVAIDGDVWKAVCETSDPVEVGTFVRVVDRESITITVKPA